MKAFAALLILPLACALAAATPAHSAEGPPVWAYPMNPPDLKPPIDDGTLRRVPDSSAGYTLTQLRDRFLAPDWRPSDYPPMPEIVARGRKPDVFACGYCHRADGPGGPENANLTGLPASYIVQQMRDYRSGARKTAVPKRNVDLMISLSKDMTDEEVEATAIHSPSSPAIRAWWILTGLDGKLCADPCCGVNAPDTSPRHKQASRTALRGNDTFTICSG